MTVDEIVRRIGERSRRLASGLPVSKAPLGSDFSLNGVVPAPATFRPASVLVPLVVRESGITVLLTQVADRLGRRRVLMVGAGLMALAGTAFAVTDDLLLLTVAATIH